jgi:hypothetical protein
MAYSSGKWLIDYKCVINNCLISAKAFMPRYSRRLGRDKFPTGFETLRTVARHLIYPGTRLRQPGRTFSSRSTGIGSDLEHLHLEHSDWSLWLDSLTCPSNTRSCVVVRKNLTSDEQPLNAKAIPAPPPRGSRRAHVEISLIQARWHTAIPANLQFRLNLDPQPG